MEKLVPVKICYIEEGGIVTVTLIDAKKKDGEVKTLGVDALVIFTFKDGELVDIEILPTHTVSIERLKKLFKR